ncbi:MAG: hypothetical protein ACR2QW_03985 [bacterium]
MNNTNNITEKDLSKMTAVSCDVVNSINFSDAGPHNEQCIRFVEFLDGLEQRYGDSDLIARARYSFGGLSRKKLDFYRFTRDMIRMTKEPLEYGETDSEPEAALQD